MKATWPDMLQNSVWLVATVGEVEQGRWKKASEQVL
jgi:hypothetical protein